jgi:hypothetical protein
VAYVSFSLGSRTQMITKKVKQLAKEPELVKSRVNYSGFHF